MSNTTTVNGLIVLATEPTGDGGQLIQDNFLTLGNWHAALATVATSGNYGDLNNTPTIPAAQVQSNWTESNTSAADYILNKPTVPTNTNQLTNGNGFITSSQAPVQSVNTRTGAIGQDGVWKQ
jgi:hypothetical protein